MNMSFQQVFSWLQAHPWLLAPACYLVTLLLLFWLRPLWLLKLDDVLQPISLKVPVLNVELSLRALLPLKHHPRVLDAWVDSKLDVARRKFAALDIVDERKIFIPMPASLEHQQQNQLLLEPRPEDLRAVFGSKRFCLLIRGEGGTGKTSLAFQIARWGMEGRELAGHRMLPVLIAQELEEKPRSFEEAIRGVLEDLTEEAISPRLLEALLRHRRLLVIVECFSELSERTRRQIQPSRADFPVYALLITSRIKEDELGVSKSVLEPRRIEGNRLSNFMNAYLELRGKRDLLDDEAYFEACRRLSQIVGQRQVTVLLVKIYAEQLVTRLEKTASEVSAESYSEELPDNIPDLMRSYVNALNRAVMKDSKREEQEVQQDTMWVAWECLKEAHYPKPAGRQEILESLARRTSDAEARLEYLEERLRLVRRIEPGDKLRFSLDPLAEYLAGLYLVEKLGADEAAWLQFLAEAEARPDAPQRTQGFLLAIRDCYLARIPGATESSVVPRKLAELAGLDPEVVHRAQRRQRIRRLISNLKVPDAEDRRHAAETLGRMGQAAREAVPALVEAVRNDSDAGMRKSAASALGQMGEAAREAIPLLIDALKDSDSEMRAQAAEALGNLGEVAREAVPALLEVLRKDSNANVLATCGRALGHMGEAAREAVPALVELLRKDSNAGRRRMAAWALMRLREVARDAVPVLVEALRMDSDSEVREQIAVTLELMGEAAREAIPTLVEILETSPNARVRRLAIYILANLGPVAWQAVPVLVRIGQDQDSPDQKEAMDALRKIQGERFSPTSRMGESPQLEHP